MTSLNLRELFRRISSLSVKWFDISVISSSISISLRKLKHLEKYSESSSTLEWTSIQSFWRPVSLAFTSERACFHLSEWCSFQRHRERIWRKYVRCLYKFDNLVKSRLITVKWLKDWIDSERSKIRSKTRNSLYTNFRISLWICRQTKRSLISSLRDQREVLSVRNTNHLSQFHREL